MNALHKADSVVSSPSTPNSSSLSSQSNLIGSPSPNTTSPATPTQSASTPLGTPFASSNSNNTGHSTSGHKNSLKGTKLARRARSFKDDLFEKISLMRTPANTMGRSHSPHSPRSKNAHVKPPPSTEEVAKSSQTLDNHNKDITNALKHFRDVILKNKLEVLPGNGTVILETIASMFSVIQTYINEDSATMVSATTQVYQSLAKLIKLCDEVLLSEESGKCASLSDENVREVVDLLDEAVKNFVALAKQKLKEKKENTFKYAPADANAVAYSQNHLMRPPNDAGQRTSLPDIPLTPNERDILEKSKSNPIRSSHSTESILRDTSPPPKPPRTINPPPLPPKRHAKLQQQLSNHQQLQYSNNASINSDLDSSADLDYLHTRSRSPDENSSQCSLDSNLNNSREEEQLKAIGLEPKLDNNLLEDDVEKMFDYNKSEKNKKTVKKKSAEGASNSAILLAAGIHSMLAAAGSVTHESAATTTTTMASGRSGSNNLDKTELRAAAGNRNSAESGFVSMNSQRASTQSMSKRSSNNSYQSSSTISSNSESGIIETINSSESKSSIFASNTIAMTTEHMSSTKISSTTTISSSSSSNTAFMTVNDDNHSISISNTSSTSPDHFDCEKMLMSQKQSISSLTKTNSWGISSSDNLMSHTMDMQPPALPPKILRNKERVPSQYDNDNDEVDDNSISINMQEEPELRHRVYQWQKKHQSTIGIVGSCHTINVEEPPPLPLKKKHILAYMEICSASTRSIEQNNRHTIHTEHMNRNITHSQTMNIMQATKEMSSPEHNILPPALPPKTNNKRKPTSLPPTIITTPPPSPKPAHLHGDGDAGMVMGIGMGAGVVGGMRHARLLSQGSEQMSTLCEELSDLNEEEQLTLRHSHHLPNERNEAAVEKRDNYIIPTCTPEDLASEELIDDDDEDVLLENNNNKQRTQCNEMPNILELIDVTPYLEFKNEQEDGPEVKGGYIDALIVHASQKNSSKAFIEAFITTFRTFIQPIDVIEKLTHRYTVFFCQRNEQKQRETFALLVRVVDDLIATDLNHKLLSLLVEFVFQLVCSGKLYLVKLLRKQYVDKVTYYRELKMPIYSSLGNDSRLHFSTATILEFKSEDIAKQMTLLDAELFQKIEIPEVLQFSKEQCEEKSPNLNKFTEHFNKMSFWARTKVLTLSDAKEREKHMFKFIKVMKHLRKMNNYNSFLALLAALASSPLRRLEWNSKITEEIDNLSTLIDNSASFHVYRQALANTKPPCIPYIGLVLQDLTFVHVGNVDYTKKDIINFSKRWQQYNIIDNMKRFKQCAYNFPRNEAIIRFFENFDNFQDEEQLWQMSLVIKPQSKRPVA